MTTPAEIRARAARIIAQVSSAGKSLDALQLELEGSNQERGLLRSLTYGTVRWQIRLEAMLAKLSSKPQQELDPAIRALLLVGLFQLLHTDIAPHAAVAETVEAARALKMPRAVGLINAVLRRCQREALQLAAEIDQDDAMRTAHPRWLVDALKRDWPERYPEILEANNAHPPMWLRVNTKRIGVEEYRSQLRSAGFDTERSTIAPEALHLIVPADVQALPGFECGDFFVQDAAAQLAAHLLAPKSGDRILDACAAPGGKTCHILELQPHADVLALDISAERMRRVHANLKRMQLQAAVVVGDAAEPDKWWDGRQFERVLLDVPCSATGVIRRHPDIKLLRRPTDIQDLADRQATLLRRIWPLLKPGGCLLYASCSVLRAETTLVVDRFLSEQLDAQDMTESAWRGLDAPWPARAEPSSGVAIYSGQAQMDGFYYACLGKLSG